MQMNCQLYYIDEIIELYYKDERRALIQMNDELFYQMNEELYYIVEQRALLYR